VTPASLKLAVVVAFATTVTRARSERPSFARDATPRRENREGAVFVVLAEAIFDDHRRADGCLRGRTTTRP
jgi:hypothetical protein